MNISPKSALEPRVAIFWDYENCAAPANVPGYIVAEQIRNAAHMFGTVTVFKAYLELSTVNISPKMINLRSELQSSGVSLTDCPRASNRKDVVDKMLLVDMLAFAMDNPAPAVIMLISGDRDFVYAVSVLRHRKYDVILVIPPQGAHITLRSQATVVLDWKYDIFAETNGGANGNSEWHLPKGDPRILGSDNEDRFRRSSPGISPRGSPVKEPLPEVEALSFGSLSMAAEPTTPTTPPKRSFDLMSPLDVHDAPFSPALSHFSPRKIPARVSQNEPTRMFSNLIETLEQWRLMGNKQPLRSQVGQELRKKNPLLYERVGVKNFNEYIALAEKAGIVKLGATDVPGREWIALADTYTGRVFPVYPGPNDG